MDYKKANIKLMEMREKILNKKCPIRNFQNCELLCMSFNEGEVYQNGVGDYKIREPYCRNPEVMGVVTHEE